MVSLFSDSETLAIVLQFLKYYEMCNHLLRRTKFFCAVIPFYMSNVLVGI